jgi:hypothetical protein
MTEIRQSHKYLAVVGGSQSESHFLSVNARRDPRSDSLLGVGILRPSMLLSEQGKGEFAVVAFC